MISIGKGRWRRLLLIGIYALGVFGILASGGSGSGSASSCGLVIQGIAPTTDASNDIWIGVLAKTDDGNVDSVVRLNEDGTEQLSFLIGVGGVENAVRTVAIAADVTDKVYVGGDFSGGILRLDPDGTLDPDFLVGSGFNGRVTSIVPLADGKVYVGGFFTTYQGENVSGLVRLNSDGSWDDDEFKTVGAGVSNVESIALATDGTFDLYSGGRSSPWVERWINNGIAAVNFNPAVFPALSLATVPLPDNEIYVGGDFTGHIVRLNSNTGHTYGGFVVGTGFDADVLSLELTVAGPTYAGGSFKTYQGVSANGIVRLNVNGFRDTNFNVGSGFTDPNDPSALSKVASLAQATDGTLDVYVGGGFSEYDGNASNGIARLKVDGSLNTGFAVRISVDGETCSNQTI